MLSDRDYMRGPIEPERQSFQLTGNQMLMIALVSILFVQAILNTASNGAVRNIFALNPENVVNHFYFWQPFTYLFFQPYGHLLQFGFVLLGLFFFGPIVETRWGWKTYLFLFFAAGAFAGLVYTPLAFIFRQSNNVLIGSVPSVMAIMVMAAMLRPNMRVLLMFLFPVKLKYVIWLFVGIDVLLIMQNPVEGIAIAVPHLAGAAFGCIYAMYHRSIDRFFASLEPEDPGSTGPRRVDDPFERQQQSPYSEEVDDILDKIHREGINSLTPEERELLEQASDELQGNDRHESF